MKDSITLHQFLPEGNSDTEKQNNELLQSSAEFEARHAQPENESQSKKQPSKDGAQLMQRIWGDNFLSDSLY